MTTPFNANQSDNSIRPANGYAGDVPLALAHDWWRTGRAVLVDVRTMAECDWVGTVPNTTCIPWKTYPDMAINPNFDAALSALVPKEQPVMLLCRSGVRSIAAATRATELGFTHAYNILEGFEGDPDVAKQRGRVNGWQYAGFPWQQT